MRTKFRNLILLVSAGMTALLLAGCGRLIINQSEEGDTKATGLEIAEPGRVLTVGETYSLYWAFTPAGSAHEAIIWQCSEEDIVNVAENGTVTALGEGTCTITGTTGNGLSDRVEVSVRLPDAPKLVLDSPEQVTLAEGETYQLKWHFAPEGSDPPAVIWESATPEYLSVDENGLLTAKTRISTSVTGTCGPESDQQTVRVTVEVTPPASELVGFKDQMIRPGVTLEFRYPNREVTGSDGRLLKPGKFSVSGHKGPSFDEEGFTIVEKKKEGGVTVAEVTFDTVGYYYTVRYSGEDWDEECEILVSEASLPETMEIKTGESAVLLDASSLSLAERMNLWIEVPSQYQYHVMPNGVKMNVDILLAQGVEKAGDLYAFDDYRIFGRLPGSAIVELYLPFRGKGR